MTKIARLWLAAILAVTLPFHSAYALSMAQGMALGQPLEQAAKDVGHGHNASPGGCEHAMDSGDRGSASDGDTSPSGASHCSACSACGTSIAISGSALPVLPSTDYVSAPLFPEQRLQGVTPSRLDRPPLVL